ncbi:F-box/kelch-repeat protein [Frankliniella fusca]|uniref:F-box/kelch-repeat protein n=1 Tax=Frankliniella fusca TaxID=407009 RepID=A0AAE1L8L3_9NEOP|nr:F-box/kelch-repeat protein [Frankliniella fusca]
MGICFVSLLGAHLHRHLFEKVPQNYYSRQTGPLVAEPTQIWYHQVFGCAEHESVGAEAARTFWGYVIGDRDDNVNSVDLVQIT